MFHANLKIKQYKKPKRKSHHSGSLNETPVQKDDEFLGNLLRRSEAPRFSVTGDPFDLDEADFECE